MLNDRQTEEFEMSDLFDYLLIQLKLLFWLWNVTLFMIKSSIMFR